jgi:hypothetical protein
MNYLKDCKYLDFKYIIQIKKNTHILKKYKRITTKYKDIIITNICRFNVYKHIKPLTLKNNKT